MSARTDLLGLFTSIALRPHSRCLYRGARVSSQFARHVSSSTSSQPKPKSTPKPELKSTPKPLPKSDPKPTPHELAAQKVPIHVGLDRNPDSVSAISRIPIPKGERGEVFTPSVLAYPLGLQHPPAPGQNVPYETRSFSERRKDFSSYEKALERRRVYLRSYLRPYFQEWRRVDYHRGKSFVSNERLFKKDKALYFPNLWGKTLSKEGDGGKGGKDTTPLLRGKVSIVCFQANEWATEQVESFVGAKENPQLNKLLENSDGMVQRIDINLQGDIARSWLVWLFKYRLRRMIPKERWDKYFMIKLPRDIRRGLTDEIRDAIGLLNSQVGYVYLVDPSCKIRWAGSGDAWAGEIDGLNAGIKKLIKDELTSSPQ
ncbi:hypothetical protein PV10_08516 [Exophiala mesophila]|uniref:Mitochondrial ATPase complex subunit ATP10 n=1 Tax=Exophiala mesophila TaxID=212818 RepID=A0A0D1Z4N5_EXOME|nr:uncharacterized protein PV10_08516 [Exophiala mesophila]KIV88884.1 hypothetical protein PV10_08516 [Exophiala mesophila]